MRLPDPPRYGEASLGELIPSLLAALGAPHEQNALALPPADRACVLMIDGLGATALAAHVEQAPFLSSLAGRRITAGFPSTTSVSLTSLGTGRCPAEHGVLGYRMHNPATPDGELHTLTWDAAVVDPLAWQPHDTAFQRAAQAGIAVGLATPQVFDGSGLTSAGMRGAQHLPAESIGERLAAACTWLSRRGPALAYVYLGDLDATGHRSGSASLAWRAELTQIDQAAQTLAQLLPAGTALYVTSDHGMLDPSVRVDVDTPKHLHLLDGVTLFTGEPRARYLHVRPGACADVLATWQAVLDGQAWVVSRDQAEAAGWFGGTLGDAVRQRVGDVVVAAGPELAIVAGRSQKRESALVGMHGSLTPAELEVPLLHLVPGEH